MNRGPDPVGTRPRPLILAFLLLLTAGGARGEEADLANDLVFYGDNTEFFEPFRLRATTLGQYFKSYLDEPTGNQTGFWAGVYVDHPSAQDTPVTVMPILAFRFHANDTLVQFGTLETVARHGMIEPLEVTTLELTRPVEYGLQWAQKGKVFKMDAFLDWQDLLTAAQRETFDYGGSMEGDLLDFMDVVGQYHGYHVGGAAYPGPVWNNFATALGPRFEVAGAAKDRDSLSVLGLLSKTIDLSPYPGPDLGCGLYTKAVVWLLPGLDLFGIDWLGQDFYSYEGDGNYNSLGYDGVYYKPERTYEELGAQFTTVIESGVAVDMEFRWHWIEGYTANSFRLLANVPFDVGIDIQRRSRSEDAKTQRMDQNSNPVQ